MSKAAVRTSTSFTASCIVDMVGFPCVFILPAAAATNFQLTAEQSSPLKSRWVFAEVKSLEPIILGGDGYIERRGLFIMHYFQRDPIVA